VKLLISVTLVNVIAMETNKRCAIIIQAAN